MTAYSIAADVTWHDEADDGHHDDPQVYVVALADPRVQVLNASAALLWRVLAELGRASFARLVAATADRAGVSSEVVSDGVRAFLEHAERQGLVSSEANSDS